MAKQTINNNESGLSVRTKLNDNFTELYGIDSGVLSGIELQFNTKERKYTKTITSDQTLSLAVSGNIADSYITLIATGDGTHTLSFPAGWIIQGDTYNPNKVHEIIFKYTGTYVIVVITVLANIVDTTPPTLISSTVMNTTPSTLDLIFSEAVTITTSGWTLSASGGAVTVSSVASGSGTTTPKFTLSRSITGGETVTISYDSSTGSTVDASSNELVTFSNQSVTNNVGSLSVLLQDDFSDGTIDTTKWDVTDPADGVTISETGSRLRFTANPASAVASTNTNYISSDLTFATSIKRVLRVTTYSNAQSINQSGLFKLYNSSDTFATARQVQLVKSNAATPKAILRIYNGSSFVYDITTAINWDQQAFMIVLETNNDVKFYNWNGSAWVQLGTTQNFNIGGSVKIAMAANSSASDTGTPLVEFDTLYMTNDTYSTVTP